MDISTFSNFHVQWTLTLDLIDPHGNNKNWKRIAYSRMLKNNFQDHLEELELKRKNTIVLLYLCNLYTTKLITSWTWTNWLRSGWKIRESCLNFFTNCLFSERRNNSCTSTVLSFWKKFSYPINFQKTSEFNGSFVDSMVYCNYVAFY